METWQKLWDDCRAIQGVDPGMWAFAKAAYTLVRHTGRPEYKEEMQIDRNDPLLPSLTACLVRQNVHSPGIVITRHEFNRAPAIEISAFLAVHECEVFDYLPDLI